MTITTSVATDIILSENDRVLLTCPDASQCVLTHNIIGKLSRIDVSVGSSYTAYFEIFDFGRQLTHPKRFLIIFHILIYFN